MCLIFWLVAGVEPPMWETCGVEFIDAPPQAVNVAARNAPESKRNAHAEKRIR
jgi:hypothetical protein